MPFFTSSFLFALCRDIEEEVGCVILAVVGTAVWREARLMRLDEESKDGLLIFGGDNDDEMIFCLFL